MNKIAFIFPGQGSQHTGMGKDLYENYECAKNFFENFDKISGKNISKLCFEGNEEDLKHTINSQPAILAVSLAAYEVFKKETKIIPDFVAGHSLGEYSALYAAGVIEIEELIRLVLKRAELMNGASAGTMSAILGLDDDKIDELINKASFEGIICPANYNTPDQTVISGDISAVEKANQLAPELGAKRVVPLPVSGAFHSPLMRPIAESFTKYIHDTNINDAEISIVTNVDAKPTIDKAELSSKMIKQMYSSVYWKQSVNYMLEAGVDTFIEIGPGKILSGMIRKISREAKVYNVCDKISLEKTMESVKLEINA